MNIQQILDIAFSYKLNKVLELHNRYTKYGSIYTDLNNFEEILEKNKENDKAIM